MLYPLQQTLTRTQDVISLVVQALGGAVASHAVGQGNNPAKVSIPPHYDA